MATIDIDALEKLATHATAEPSSDDDGDFRYRCHGCGVLYALAPECDPSALCNDCVHRIAEDLGHGVLGLIALARRTEEADRECAAEREAALHAERERDDATARAEQAERERDALRAALIHVAGLQIRRDADAVEVRAIRATANDLSAPFSDEQVTARLVEWRAGTRDAAAARIAEVMRERDEARAALRWDETDWNALMSRKSDLVDRKIGGSASTHELAELGALQRLSTRRRDYEAPLPVEWLQRMLAAGAPARPPLDPAHVEVLRRLAEDALSSKRWALESLKEQYTKKTEKDEAALEQEIAALEAVLGEEVKP